MNIFHRCTDFLKQTFTGTDLKQTLADDVEKIHQATDKQKEATDKLINLLEEDPFFRMMGDLQKTKERRDG